MRTTNWREVNWSQLGQAWDILIVGGGITGAGILREASRLGFHSLLVEQHDFASGASSRSSKLVHGGLRYLKDGQFQLARDAVRQRERAVVRASRLLGAAQRQLRRSPRRSVRRHRQERRRQEHDAEAAQRRDDADRGPNQ